LKSIYQTTQTMSTEHRTRKCHSNWTWILLQLSWKPVHYRHVCVR